MNDWLPVVDNKSYSSNRQCEWCRTIQCDLLNYIVSFLSSIEEVMKLNDIGSVNNSSHIYNTPAGILCGTSTSHVRIRYICTWGWALCQAPFRWSLLTRAYTEESKWNSWFLKVSNSPNDPNDSYGFLRRALVLLPRSQRSWTRHETSGWKYPFRYDYQVPWKGLPRRS
jgi:hypothetical protein